jgi:hypothetical protein
MSSSFTLERFETSVRLGQPDDAIRLICELEKLFSTTGDIELQTLMAPSTNWPPRSKNWLLEHFVSRLAAALISLLGNTDFVLSDGQFGRLVAIRSWLKSCTAAAPLGNADHVAQKFLPVVADDGAVHLPFPDAIKRLDLLCSCESRLPIDYATCFRLDPPATLNLAIAMASELLPGSPEAHRRREAVIDWLIVVLPNIETEVLNSIQVAGLLALYMCCTYAEIEHRHAIKRSINLLLRRTLAASGLCDLEMERGAAQRAKRQRPLMLVVLDMLVDGHSILRTHSVNLKAARAHFDIVAICRAAAIGEQGRDVFDRVIEFRTEDNFNAQLHMLRTFAEAECPDVLYMPSVGMTPYTLFVSNMRLAPLQIAGLGHPATTHSECIDYVSVEDDYVGDPACFSEAIMRLPSDAQPYRPSTFMEAVGPRKKSEPSIVKIAIAASVMKVSASFLHACREIARRSKVPVQFELMTSGGNYMTLLHLMRVATQVIGSRNVHAYSSLPYMTYIQTLNDADMFLSPFPFGNTNGIVDAFTVGLPGVCKTGREVFERIDGAMFMRAYMPGWLVADTVEEYIEAAVRLANNHEERESLRRFMLEKNVAQRFFEGRPEVFGEMVLDLVNKQRIKTA